MNAPLLLTPAKAAEYLGVQQSILYEWINEGIVPVRQIGKRRRIARADLERLVEEAPCHTAEKTQNTGGSTTRTDAAVQLRNLLGKPRSEKRNELKGKSATKLVNAGTGEPTRK